MIIMEAISKPGNSLDIFMLLCKNPQGGIDVIRFQAATLPALNHFKFRIQKSDIAAS